MASKLPELLKRHRMLHWGELPEPLVLRVFEKLGEEDFAQLVDMLWGDGDPATAYHGARELDQLLTAQRHELLPVGSLETGTKCLCDLEDPNSAVALRFRIYWPATARMQPQKWVVHRNSRGELFLKGVDGVKRVHPERKVLVRR